MISAQRLDEICAEARVRLKIIVPRDGQRPGVEGHPIAIDNFQQRLSEATKDRDEEGNA